MVEFNIPTSCPRLAIAVAAAHGSTDIIRGRKLISYAIAALPLPGWCVTTAFALSSLLHFANDVGLPASVLGHSLLLGLYQHGRQKLAFTALIIYMLTVHVPAHYAAVYQDEQHGQEAVVFAMQVTQTLALLPLWEREFPINHFVQKIVISHVACNSF